MANILFQWLVVAYAGIVHPFYVSMTDISYNDKTQSLEISVRIFTDDFENTLRKYHAEKIDILNPANRDNMNKYISDYIQQHLQFKIDGKAVQMNFVGFEQQSESIWSYFETGQVGNIKTVAIENSLLHDYHNSQINMLHMKVKGKEASNKLNYPETTTLFNF